MSILSAHEISKSYKLRKVVKSLSLEIKSGEVVGLLGPNGAGKTTAFYMIVGLVSADTGTILLDGQDLTAQAMHQRSKLGLGYLPQEASIFRKLSVEQNILAILEVRDDLDRAGREQELPPCRAVVETVLEIGVVVGEFQFVVVLQTFEGKERHFGREVLDAAHFWDGISREQSADLAFARSVATEEADDLARGDLQVLDLYLAKFQSPKSHGCMTRG